MIQLQNIALSFGGQTILDGVTWTIKPGQRIGLIGPNGAGKTTMLRVISGQQECDDGTVSKSGGMEIGYLAQDAQELASQRSVVEEAMRAFDAVLDLQKEEERITQALASEPDHGSTQYQKLLLHLDRVHASLVTKDAYMIRPKTEAVLTGLGFEPDDLDRSVDTFSGGWRMRIALAQILLRQPDVLLLDEPTNHLDIVSIDWLEGYLKNYPGTVVIVSHDRYFLDRMVTTIAELASGQVTEYAGNYIYYLTERTKRRELLMASYLNQQKKIAETERFIQRFRAKATKARQVQSRVKQLERLERIAPPPSEEAQIMIRFPEPHRSGRVVMELSAFSKTYDVPEGAICVFDRADPLMVERGDKIALMGKNGAGKSTLARILDGTEPFDGTRKVGYQVDMTFFAQHQAEALNPNQTILESLQAIARGQNITELRTLLGAFLFTGDDVFKKIRVLSGGEKSRVALAHTLLHPANFLILDEPTNHLDIQSINVLIEALKQYSGSFVVVSHDRHFLDQVVNKVWDVGDGRVREYRGTYSEYQWYLKHGSASQLAPSTPKADAPRQPSNGASTPSERTRGPKTKEQKRREAEQRNLVYRALQHGEDGDYSLLTPFQLQKLNEQIEATILEKEKRQADLEAALGDPTLYENAHRSRTTTDAYDAIQEELAALYQQWETLAEHLAA